MPDTPADVWQDCLPTIRSLVQSQSFKTWFDPIEVDRFDPHALVIRVPDAFFRDWISEHYGWVIERAVYECKGWRPEICFQFETSTDSDPPAESASPPQIELTFPINNRYRFDNFVVGEGNEFAFSAAQAVAQSPGKTAFNPLLIYSGVGLGKTHLLQAIGHHCQTSATARRIVFVTAEKFISDYISSIRRRDTSEFVATYRTADILLVDDVQFFLQTEGSQREFFHTFNTLFQNDKQIVLTADCAPPNLKGFEPRLVSRFESGLVSSIDAPNLETRIAILNHKAESRGTTLPEDVARYIAERHATNVRELEGALTRVLAFAELKREHLTASLVSRLLPQLIQSTTNRNLTLSRIQETTAEFFSLSVEDLTGASRKHELAQARHVGMFLCKSLTPSPLKAIGTFFGRKDHTTVIHACRSVEKRIDADPAFRELVRQLKAKLLREGVG